MANNCKNCKHWMNKQMLLNYSHSNGFCVNEKFQFNTNDGRLVGVVDTQNLRDRTQITGDCSHDFEVKKIQGVDPSRYLLKTEAEFGCIFFEQQKQVK